MTDGTQKVALVTGAARGIGLETAKRFLADGWYVALLDIDSETLGRAHAALPADKTIAICCDVADAGGVSGAVARVAERFGRLDALVNNAGIAIFKPILDVTYEDWSRVLAVNLTGPFLCVQSAAPLMRDSGGGAIVNITSISGLRASTLRTAYGTSKAALAHLTQQQAVELASLGIRVNAVAPGPVDTAMAKAVHTPEIRTAYHEVIPLNRYGLEQELAEMIFFLCSDRASYITGQTIAVDGGFEATGIGLPALRRTGRNVDEPPRIAGPVLHPKAPRVPPPRGAWDSHFHIFGPADKFPYQPGRAYTPPDAPVERLIVLLDHLGFAKGLVVQGNAHVYDNRVVLDALQRYPKRLRGVAITDTRIKPETLRDWDKLGMRGLRFHLFPEAGEGARRGVDLDVFEVFRETMADLGWVAQFFCDHRMLAPMAATLRDISRDMPVIVDHLGMVPAAAGIGDPNFQALLRLVGEGHAYVKVSAVYRLSTQYPDYEDARPLYDALLCANPERLIWGTDWPHPSIPAEVMPDDGHLLDLFHDWTSDEQMRRRILVQTPARLFGR